MHTEHDAVENTTTAAMADVIHSQDIGLAELRLNAEYGLRDGLGIGVVVPLRYVDTSIRYLDQTSRSQVELTAPNIHHRNERLFRLADPWLLGHLAVTRGRWMLDLRAGVSLPLGRTENDPFDLGDRGLAHQHLQFGTGTFNPVLGAEVRRNFHRWSLGGYALTQQMLYENTKGYHAGDRYAAGITAQSGLGTKNWSFLLGPDFQAEAAERWRGVVHTDDGNQGRFDILGTVGIVRTLGRGLFATATVRARIYTYVVGGQLEYPMVLELGLGWLLGGKPTARSEQPPSGLSQP